MDKEVFSAHNIDETGHSPDHQKHVADSPDKIDTLSNRNGLSVIREELENLKSEFIPDPFGSELTDIGSDLSTREKMIASSGDKKPAVDISLFVNNLADPDIQESFITAAASGRKEFATRVGSMQDKAGVPTRLQV